MIGSMDMVLKHGLMELYIEVTIKMEENMEKGFCSFQMDQHLKGIFSTMKLMAMEYINGQMGRFMKAIGSIIRWRAEEF